MKTKLSIDKERLRSRRVAPERQEMKRPWGELRRLLAARGDRLTPQRMAIYDAVVGRSTHPSVDTVYDQVHKRFPSLSRATVYVTLSLFADLGLVQEVSGPIRRYDGQAARHVNLVCERCGSVVDVFDTRLQDIERKVASRARFSVRKTRFELHGICPTCQRSA